MKLNSVIKPPGTSQPEARINMPAALPLVSVNAREESAAPVGGVCTGDLPKSEAVDRSRGQRGPDKNPGSRPRNKCARCAKWCQAHMFICRGKGGLINATFLMMIANEGAVAAKEHMIWKRWKKDNRKPKACIFTAA